MGIVSVVLGIFMCVSRLSPCPNGLYSDAGGQAAWRPSAG